MQQSQQDRIIAEAKAFADNTLRSLADRFEDEKAIPREVIDSMANRGYLAASLPEDYGGLGLDPVHYGLFTEEIGKGCSAARALLTVHTSLVGETILRWGTEEQKNRWLRPMSQGASIAAFCLTEPFVGTDAGSVQTAYERHGDRYVIHGRKKWITLGGIADLFLVICRRDSAVSAFMVERKSKGVRTEKIPGLLAGRSEHIAEVEFDRVEVPAENLLGREGSGFAYIVNTALDHGRYSVAWAGVAIAHEALDSMVTYSRQRSQFGRKIHNFQLIEGLIADSTVQLYAARALCLRAGELRKVRDEQAIIETTIAKVFASRIAMNTAINAVQVHGGNGCCNRYPAERLFREAKVLEIIEGTTQVLQDVIAKYSLRKHHKKTVYYQNA